MSIYRLQISETSKNKPCAILNGYEYRIQRKNKDGTIAWSCRNEKAKNCKGRLYTKDDDVLRTTDHICIPDEAKVEINKMMQKAKKRAREEDTMMPEIYKEELSNLSERGYDFVTELPLYSTVKSGLNKIRRKTRGIVADPKSRIEIQLTEEMFAIHKGKDNFLLYDSADEERIILLASTKGRNALINNRTCFMDGTFKSICKQFQQLYTLHVDVGSTDDETNVIPAVYALLPNKRKQTYERMFSAIKENIPEWNPKEITLDFETATLISLRSIFPDARIHGCNFHFNQCLWRKVQDLHLKSKYMEDEDIRLHIRMCAALAYIPLEKVDEGWLTIEENSPMDPDLRLFYDYFVEHWLESEAVPKEMWNCFNIRHRTNNSVEGWNFRLNHLMRRPHPNFSLFIKTLKEEAEHNDFLYDRNSLHLEGVKRKQKYKKLDQRISNILRAYEENDDIKACLKALAYVQKLE